MVQVDVSNIDVVQQHLMCAALEYPVSPLHDARFFGEAQLAAAAARLVAAGLLARRPGAAAPAAGGPGDDPALHQQLVYTGPQDSPAQGICLRTIDPERFTIWDESSGMPLEEIEANMAFYEVGVWV